MAVKHTDSSGKVLQYLERLGSDKVLVVSPLLFRDFSCPAGCGGCCLKFSLDYWDGPRWEAFKQRYPEQVSRFKERLVRGVRFYTDAQDDNTTRWCRNLILETGRCGVHEANPFTCEFELIRIMPKGDNETLLLSKLFGRGWQFERVDGGTGALCSMGRFNYQKLQRDIELFKELAELAERMRLDTKLGKLLAFFKVNESNFARGLHPTKATIL